VNGSMGSLCERAPGPHDDTDREVFDRWWNSRRICGESRREEHPAANREIAARSCLEHRPTWLHGTPISADDLRQVVLPGSGGPKSNIDRALLHAAWRPRWPRRDCREIWPRPPARPRPTYWASSSTREALIKRGSAIHRATSLSVARSNGSND
jgi:hypothetical protein